MIYRFPSLTAQGAFQGTCFHAILQEALICRSCYKGRMRPTPLLPLLLAAALPLSASLSAQTKPDTPVPSIATKTASMHHLPGLLPLDWDGKSGKLYLEIPHLNQNLLYTDSLPYGTGSNDIGLDRGQTADGRIVHFERVGPKVLLV